MSAVGTRRTVFGFQGISIKYYSSIQKCYGNVDVPRIFSALYIGNVYHLFSAG